MTHSELLELVYRFYPRGVFPYAPAHVPLHERSYHDTDERRRVLDAARRGGQDYPTWKAMIDRLGDQLVLQDESLHLLSGGADPAYSARMYRPGDMNPGDPLMSRASLSFHVSLLGPYYGVHDTGEQGGKEAAIIIGEIETTYPGYKLVPPEIGNEVVPDVGMDGVAFGAATIYVCLFSPVWEWVEHDDSPSPELTASVAQEADGRGSPVRWARSIQSGRK